MLFNRLMILLARRQAAGPVSYTHLFGALARAASLWIPLRLRLLVHLRFVVLVHETVTAENVHFPLPSDLCCPSYAKWFDAGARFARATLAKL